MIHISKRKQRIYSRRENELSPMEQVHMYHELIDLTPAEIISHQREMYLRAKGDKEDYSPK